MNEYISFGKVIKTVNGIEYDVSENYEIVEKGKVAELEKENEELKARLEFATLIVKDVYKEYKNEEWVVVDMMKNFLDNEQGE